MKTIFLLLTSLVFSSITFANFDPEYKKQWYLDYQKDGLGVDVKSAWQYTKGKKSIIVAVVDSGIDHTHEDLKDQIWINTKEIPDNQIDDDNNGYVDDVRGYNFVGNNNKTMDTEGHGTHVAGIIGASHNSIGIMGIMKDVRIMTVRVLDGWGGEQAKIAKGIDYAIDNGADVINLSLTGSREMPIVYESLLRAQKKNIIVVAAAGNFNTSTPYYPAAYNLPNIISVASVDLNNIKSTFSNYGKDHVHVFAPGSDIYSLKPGNNYVLNSGTSMAAPVVSGIVGLILSVHGKASAKNMRERLMYTSSKLKRLDGMVSSRGVINAPNAIKGQMSLDILLD